MGFAAFGGRHPNIAAADEGDFGTGGTKRRLREVGDAGRKSCGRKEQYSARETHGSIVSRTRRTGWGEVAGAGGGGWGGRGGGGGGEGGGGRGGGGGGGGGGRRRGPHWVRALSRTA